MKRKALSKKKPLPPGRQPPKTTPPTKAARQQCAPPKDPLRAAHQTEPWLNMISGTPDPFAMPNRDNPFWFLETLESKTHPFAPPDPLALGGALSFDWHSFLSGPLSPFAVALGLRSPVGCYDEKCQMSTEAARQVLRAFKVPTSFPVPWGAGWLLGFGLTAAKHFEKWNVKLNELAKASPRLKRHLFNRAADLTERDVEAVRLFLNGFCDGVKAGQETELQCTAHKWRLFVALRGHDFQSNCQIVKALKEHRLVTESQIRPALRVLSELRNPPRRLSKETAVRKVHAKRD